MAAEMTHDEAEWLIDALISMTTLCNKLEEKGMTELQAEADEVYDHIRDLAIELLGGKMPSTYTPITVSPGSGWIMPTSDRDVVTCQ